MYAYSANIARPECVDPVVPIPTRLLEFDRLASNAEFSDMDPDPVTPKPESLSNATSPPSRDQLESIHSPTASDARVLYVRLCREVRSTDPADEQALRNLGYLIDLSGDLKRPWGLRWALSAAERLLSAGVDLRTAGVLHYFVANAWSSLRTLQRRDEASGVAFTWVEPEGVEEIANLRLAREALAKAGDSYDLRCQVLTNLGNALSARGRLIEAVEAWDEALRISPRFGMALGNRGMGLEWYASLAYDPGHQLYLLREAHRCLAAATNCADVYPTAGEVFARVRERIEAAVPRSALHSEVKPWSPARQWSAEERGYRTWCAHERLFLNDLNDISVDPIVMADVLGLPSLVTSLDEGPALLGFFNQIKQEFVTSRLLLYRGIHADDVHFADRDVTLVNTLDYPVYSIAAEEIKLAYRSLYSIFDKLAFFLNDYLELGIPERHIFFKTLWYTHRQPQRGVRPELVARHNTALRALFWLSQDLFAPGERSSDLAAKKMAEIRQELEHKYLKLHEYHHGVMGRVERHGDVSHDRLAYSLGRTEFVDRALQLARLVRAALIYLVFAVRIEEQDRATARPAQMLTVPMDVPVWDDEWKR